MQKKGEPWLSLFLPVGRRVSELKGLYEDVQVKYLSLAGKAGLVLFWSALLLVWSAPLDKPFASLLGAVALAVVLLNLLCLVLFSRQVRTVSGRWLDRLQLLLFGAFHLQGLALEVAHGEQPQTNTGSENQAGAGEADKQHAD
jgi:putative membrane protein